MHQSWLWALPAMRVPSPEGFALLVPVARTFPLTNAMIMQLCKQ